MANNNSDAHLLVSRDRSPLQDVTNSSLHTSTESSSAARNKSSQSWYARLSDEKKAKLLEKRRVARQQKKAAAVGTDNHAQEAQPHASSISSEQCIPLSDITNTQIDVAICTAASSAGTVQLQRDNIVGRKRSGQSWYAGLSDERRAEYINKQKMARLARKAATGGVNVQVPTPSAPQTSSAHTSAPANYGVREHQLREIVGQCSTSAPANYGGREHQLQEIVGQCSKHDLEEEGSDDWLHTNPTYVRQLRSAKHVHDVLELSGSHEEDSSVPTSFISGRSIEPLDAYHEKDRLRKKEELLRNEISTEGGLAESESREATTMKRTPMRQTKTMKMTLMHTGFSSLLGRLLRAKIACTPSKREKPAMMMMNYGYSVHKVRNSNRTL